MSQVTEREAYGGPSGWTGWIAFAATMMILAGGLNVFYGIVALVNDTWVGWNSDTASAVVLDVTQWGWVHFIVGVLLLLSGFGVMTGNVLARTVGVLIAAGNLIANFFFIPVYPVWALIIVVIDVLVIWALTVHGGEVRAR
jgi:hypothetical protein